MIDWLSSRHWAVRAALAIAAGVLTALAFQPYRWWPLLPVGVAGLSLAVLAARRLRGAAGLGFGYGIGFLLLGVGWMRVIFVQAMVGLVVAEALFYLVLAVVIKLASRSRWWPLLAAASWTAVEFSFARFPFDGFGWMRLGYAMVDSPLAGALPLIGVTGVGLLAALAGQLLAWVVVAPRRARWLLSGGTVLAMLAISVLGAQVPAGAGSGEVSVGYVQGGAPGGGVYGLGPKRTITRNQVAETTRLAEKVSAGTVARPDFVVWPENSTDADPFTDAETGQLVRTALDRIQVPIFVGAILDGPGAEERQTASLWWHPTQGEQARYIKRGIVPFGEWVPLRPLLLPLIPELSYVGKQSVAGTEPGAIDVALDDGREFTVGVMVCYDLAFDDIVYDTVRYGGEVMVVQSSNAMYQGTGQIDQQFAITRARAMELRREILVVTTSGVSGLIEPDGTVAFSVPDYTSASGVVDLPLRSGVTVATWLAPVLELSITLLALFGLGFVLWYGRMDKRLPRPGDPAWPTRRTPLSVSS